MRDSINKMHDKPDDTLSNVKDFGERILKSMVPGWKNSMEDSEVQPQREDRLIPKITYSLGDLDFASELQANISCFKNHKSYWREELENLDGLLQGIRYKMFNPPMPPITKLFKLCLRFQDYVRVERAADQDIWGEYLHDKGEFITEESRAGKEKFLQIVVGGRNKYQINGHLAQPSRVQNLFHSVQLNVNNPHFLIMQGRITKVLNMKPPEILSMLEEAAGTRMYEMKKESALKTLEKKQTKVNEIDNVLTEEILPALEKLRKERVQYVQWANGNAELDRLKRFCIAYEFVQAEKVRDDAVSGVEQIKSKILKLKNSMEQIQLEINDKEKAISDLSAEKESQLGGYMKALSEMLHKSIQDIENSIQERDAAVLRADEGAADLKLKIEDMKKNLEDHEKEYQRVLAGKSSGDEEKCLDDQLVDAKAAVGSAETEAKQLKTKINHLEKELKDKKKILSSKEKEANAVERELQSKRHEVEKIKTAMEGVAYEEGCMGALEKERLQESEAVQKLKADIRHLEAQLGNVQFTYSDPVKHFDRSKVEGVVAQLLKVKDASTMTALEVAAGGKLFNVVVDTEQTGKLLLEKGGLRRRVTIIPLNKIQAHTISSRTQEAAAKLVGNGNARLALSLVGYEDEIEAAMAFVFGGTFVCSNSDAAKEVT
ncbi:structural maintenance of chromosomes protein 2-1-like [Cryptomeria japonica]|uniref:structural maintenance of chromosomes protein 2-1-like n=1 Tax=Cryptomeria japonica TaxID=3369 RepID=UPI0027DA2B42|nr:structural maintenance of chromosomes protein 2-1-like [Cryptomeria japonica]